MSQAGADGETVLLICSGINHNKDHRPEEMVALRILSRRISSSAAVVVRRSGRCVRAAVAGGGADIHPPTGWWRYATPLTDRAGSSSRSCTTRSPDLEEMVLMRDLPANGRLARIRKAAHHDPSLPLPSGICGAPGQR